MSKRLLFIGVILLLLITTAATPFSVRAEGDPPPAPDSVKPPWITGVNPDVKSSTDEVEELSASGLIESWQGVEVPLLAAPPSYVDLEPQLAVDSTPSVDSLAVPQLYQDPGDVTCGAAALGMALEFLSLNREGQAPSQATLVRDLKNTGLLYETGTGVEELAFLARQYGYQGTTAFHDWSLEKLGEQLSVGNPVVVSLGSNGADQPGHFVTLTGISADGNWVSYNDPVLGKQTVSAADFIKSWNLQDNSGLLVQKDPISALNDPMLPWMGLFSAMAMLAVMAKTYPLGDELTSTLADIRSVLSNPGRKGFGGKLVADGGNSSAPSGYKWVKKSVPVYGWKNVDIIEKVQVPNIVRTYGVVRTKVWTEKIPEYKTVKVDRGHWAYRSVKKYRIERYRVKERYPVKKYYWYRRNGRLRRGSYTIWKTRTVVKKRRVPYYDREKYWVPKIVEEQRFVRYREIEHREPVYGWKEEVRGTRTIERTKTTRAWAKIGTEIKWELVKLPQPPKPEPDYSHKLELIRNRNENYQAQQETLIEQNPVLDEVPSFFKDPLGYLQTSLINLGRQNDTVQDILESTLAPAADWLQNFSDPEDHPVLAWVHKKAIEAKEGWSSVFESVNVIAGYTIDAIKDGRWEDVGNVVQELSDLPAELTDEMIKQYDDLPFIAQLGIGIAPGGDAVDIVKETRNVINNEPVDEVVLGLSLFGIVMDLGWADGIIPDPADGGNGAAAFLKALLKNLDDGPSREIVEKMIKNPDDWKHIIETVEAFVKHGDELKHINDPDLLVWILSKGPDTVETVAKNVTKFGDDATEIAQVFKAGERLSAVGVHADETEALIDTILDLSVRGSGDRLVIGKYFNEGEGYGYLQNAAEHGGKFFQTPEDFYNLALGKNKEVMEAINKQYIRRFLEGGIDEIDLVEETIDQVRRARPGTFTDMEIGWIEEITKEIAEDAAFDFKYILEGESWVKVKK